MADGGKVVKVAVLLRLDDDIEALEVGSVNLTAPDNGQIAALLRRLADEVEASDG